MTDRAIDIAYELLDGCESERCRVSITAIANALRAARANAIEEAIAKIPNYEGIFDRGLDNHSPCWDEQGVSDLLEWLRDQLRSLRDKA